MIEKFRVSILRRGQKPAALIEPRTADEVEELVRKGHNVVAHPISKNMPAADREWPSDPLSQARKAAFALHAHATRRSDKALQQIAENAIRALFVGLDEARHREDIDDDRVSRLPSSKQRISVERHSSHTLPGIGERKTIR